MYWPITVRQLGIHITDILGYDEDGADECGVNDIDTSLISGISSDEDYQLDDS